jgi:hypothetical protein
MMMKRIVIEAIVVIIVCVSSVTLGYIFFHSPSPPPTESTVIQVAKVPEPVNESEPPKADIKEQARKEEVKKDDEQTIKELRDIIFRQHTEGKIGLRIYTRMERDVLDHQEEIVQLAKENEKLRIALEQQGLDPYEILGRIIDPTTTPLAIEKAKHRATLAKLELARAEKAEIQANCEATIAEYAAREKKLRAKISALEANKR